MTTPAIIIFPEPKDPNAVLDYKWDFASTTNGSNTRKADWLASGETIASYTVTVVSGSMTVTTSSKTDSNTSITAWLSGGTDGEECVVTCHIVTTSSPARQDDRSIVIKVAER